MFQLDRRMEQTLQQKVMGRLHAFVSLFFRTTWAYAYVGGHCIFFRPLG